MKRLCTLLVLALLLTACGKKQTNSCQSGHIDQNNDTKCDRCAQFMLVRFDFYAVNDLHGKLEDTEFQPGVDELSTYLKQAQQTGNTILLSTGDMWQGAAESNLTDGHIITEWMNQMDFAAMTLGGHEFDWGQEKILKNKELANFPFLGINIYSWETNQRVDYCDSSLVVDMEGVQIGIIGAIGDCYNSVSSQMTKDVYFKTGEELTALVKAEADKLRQQGVDFIIYCIHDGYDQTTEDTKAMEVTARELEGYYDTVLSGSYVDLVFEADSHYWYMLQDNNQVYHLQAGANNKGISHATVLINKANSNSEILSAELIPASTYVHMDDHPVVADLLKKYADPIAPAYEVLGENRQYRGSSDLCQIIADLYCEAGMEKWGAAYDIVLGGGYMSCRSPSYMPAGQITYGQVYSLFPFDNEITLCSIKGSDLLSRFLENDHYAYYIQTTDYGNSIRENIDPEGVYYVVTDSYSAYYSYNHMTVIDVYDHSTFARNLLADHIAAGNL